MKMLSKKFRKACNSFDGDTLVHTSNGLKKIKHIKIGEKVWAYDEETGETTLQEVIHLIRSEGDKNIIDITLQSGEVISATEGHPFYVPDEKNAWIEAEDLRLDMNLLARDKGLIAITELLSQHRQSKVYNLTVNNDHTYFVGETGLLVHNAGGCKSILSFNTKHFIGGDRHGGLHSIHGLSSNRRILKKGPVDKQDLYTAKVEIRWGKNPKDVTVKNSTFFPDNWSEKKIMDEIYSAYIRHAGRNGKGMKFTERSASGVLIDIELERWGDGVRVKTAFPRKKP